MSEFNLHLSTSKASIKKTNKSSVTKIKQDSYSCKKKSKMEGRVIDIKNFKTKILAENEKLKHEKKLLEEKLFNLNKLNNINNVNDYNNNTKNSNNNDNNFNNPFLFNKGKNNTSNNNNQYINNNSNSNNNNISTIMHPQKDYYNANITNFLNTYIGKNKSIFNIQNNNYNLIGSSYNYEAASIEYINSRYSNNILSIIKKIIDQPDSNNINIQNNYPLFNILLKICKYLMLNEIELACFSIFIERFGWNNENMDLDDYLLSIAILTKCYVCLDANNIVNSLFNEIKGFNKVFNIFILDIVNKHISNENNISSILYIDITEINQKYIDLSQPYNSYCKDNYIDYNFCVDQILSMSLPYSDSKKVNDNNNFLLDKYNISNNTNNLYNYKSNNSIYPVKELISNNHTSIISNLNTNINNNISNTVYNKSNIQNIAIAENPFYSFSNNDANTSCLNINKINSNIMPESININKDSLKNMSFESFKNPNSLFNNNLNQSKF